MSRYRSTSDIFDVDAMVTYVIESDEFTEAIAESRQEEIKGWIDTAIADKDIEQMVKDEIPDISDLENKVEELEGQIDSLKERLDKQMALLEELQKQNFNLWKNFENQLNKNKQDFWSFINYLRSYPVVGRWITWTT